MSCLAILINHLPLALWPFCENKISNDSWTVCLDCWSLLAECTHIYLKYIHICSKMFSLSYFSNSSFAVSNVLHFHIVRLWYWHFLIHINQPDEELIMKLQAESGCHLDNILRHFCYLYANFASINIPWPIINSRPPCMQCSMSMYVITGSHAYS